jgi:hypothetical protein
MTCGDIINSNQCNSNELPSILNCFWIESNESTSTNSKCVSEVYILFIIKIIPFLSIHL